MTHRNWLPTVVLAMGSVLAAPAVLPSIAQAKDGIPAHPKLLEKAPAGAVILFDGKPQQMHDNWYARRSTDPAAWNVDKKGVATPNHRDISSKKEFGDCYLHAEFREPMKGSGNSGVGLEGRYEIQILNSYGKKPESHECGAFYSESPPKVIASKPAGEWQTYDIFFRAAIRCGRQSCRKGPGHRLPKRHPDPQRRGIHRPDRHPIRAIQRGSAERTGRLARRPRHGAIPQRLARAREVLSPPSALSQQPSRSDGLLTLARRASEGVRVAQARESASCAATIPLPRLRCGLV